MAKLFLLRHLKSQWNEENRFTGWIDIPLSKKETQKVRELAEKIPLSEIDKIYSSPLFRNEDTVAKIFESSNKYPVFIHLDKGKMKDWGHFKDISKEGVLVFVSEKLNERYYGQLQGENKDETIKKYGVKIVRLWRRSYNTAPPGGESLADVYKRAIPFYRKFVEKDLKQGKNVLIVASHNSLRAIVKYVEKIPDKDVFNLEIPYAGLREYDFTKDNKYNKIKEQPLIS